MQDLKEMIRRVDELLEHNQGAEAEALMQQGIVMAMQEEDDEAVLSLINELMGFYRESGRKEDSYTCAAQALALAQRMGLKETIPYATTLLNAANAYRAGGRLEDSMECYKEALAIYRREFPADDMLMASLYNNISLLYQEMEDFSLARTNLLNALAIVQQQPDAGFELAVTYTNLAATDLKLGMDEEAWDCAQRAISYFTSHGVRDAHYSAALSAAGISLYQEGMFESAARLFEEAMECLRASVGENEYYRRLAEYLAACREHMEDSAAGKSHGKDTVAEVSRRGNADAGKSCEEEGKKPITGLELCRAYYEAYGAPMLRAQFPEYLSQIAVGLAGEGSDCFGYDDALSRDHDWGPDFCLWVTQEVWDAAGERLAAAYEALPKDYLGFSRNTTSKGRGRRGVRTINDFYGSFLGEGDWESVARSARERLLRGDGEADRAGREEEILSKDSKRACEDAIAWQEVPDESLAACINGQVWQDDAGLFSALRRELSAGYPLRIQYLKVAQSAGRFSQTGQYNYSRMRDRDDPAAAQLMLGDCLREAARLCYYRENRFPPHDKWLFRGLRDLTDCGKEASLIREIACMGGQSVSTVAVVSGIEALADLLVKNLYRRSMVSDVETYLDNHVGELLYKAQYADREVKDLAEEIARLEFKAFDQVQNEGGRAFCQDDWPTFSIMRRSQYLTWNRTMLLQYLYDFDREYRRGHNLITEKYGRMMESTAPEEYARIKDNFPVLDDSKKAIIEAIVQLQVGWMEEFGAHFPALAENARSIHTAQDRLDNTSYETYLRGELGTYSDKMLELYGRYVTDYARQGKNLAYAIMENSVLLYGYRNLQEAELWMSRLRVKPQRDRT